MKQGWTYKKLGEVCETLNGLWKGKKPPYVNVGVIRNANFTKDFKLRFDNIEYLDVEERQYSKRKLQSGDLIIEKSGGSEKQPVGRAVLFEKEEGEFSFSNFTSVLRIKDKKTLSSKFLFIYLYFIYKRGDTLTMQKATTGIHNIEFEKYLNIDIPSLPLSEQQRIVSRLDSAFAHIDALKANAEKQLSDAKALFQKALEKAMEPKEGWEEKKFKSICKFIRGPFGGSLKKECFKDSGYAVYEQQNAIYNRFSFRYFIDEKKYKEMERFSVQTGDLIMSCSGTIGKVAIVPENAAKGIINQALLKLTPCESIDKYFLKNLMESSFFEKLIQANSDGAAIKNIASVQILKELDLYIPTLSEQQAIVSRLDSLSENVKRLQEVLEKTIKECDALKQAMLRQVFE